MHKLYIHGLIFLSVITVSCNKNDKDLPAPTRTYYMSAKVDGKSVAYDDSIHGVLNKSSISSTDHGTFTLTKSSSSFSGKTQFGDSVNTVFSQFKKGCKCSPVFVDSLFTTGDYSFTGNQELEGIEIVYYDGSKTYSTSSGTADQRGSFFKISKHQFVDKPGYRYISSGNLNCKLYSTDGDVKIMSGYFNIKTNNPH